MYAIRTEAVSCRPGWPQWSYINFVSSMFRLESESDLHNGDGLIIFLVLLRWWYTPAIMIFMTFFLVKYLAEGAGTEAK